jgi:phosphoesterase RecJ-like protein
LRIANSLEYELSLHPKKNNLEQITKEFTEKATAYLAEAENIIIVAHKNPDGDALGSGLALYHILKNKNKKVTFIVPNQLPTYLNWMPGIEDVIVYENQKELGIEYIQKAQLIFMVDFNHRSRLSEMGDKIIPLNVPKIMIDHHPYPEEIADLTYSRTSSSSTAEMIYEFTDAIYGKSAINKKAADCMFLGIMTDTGSFSYNSSSQLTFQVVGHLLSLGVNKDEITDKVYSNYSEYRLRLLGHAINTKLTVLPEYGAAHINLTQKELEEFKFEPGDTEGFVNYPLSIKEVEFTAIFIEKDNYTKCSFRSKGSFPANLVAKEHFSGGGHTNAAGGENKDTLANTIAKFESILPQYKKYLNQ